MKPLPIFLCVLIATTSSLLANTYLWKPLEPPTAADVTAFSNGPPPATNQRIAYTREDILRYLSEGKAFFDRKAIGDYLTANNYPGERGFILWDRDQNARDGVIVTGKGKVIFWQVMSPLLLRLETSDTEQCYLLLPPDPTGK